MTNMTAIQFSWLDANMYNDQNKQLLKKIRDMTGECMEFVEEDECKRFLGRGVNDPRQFILIVSGQLGEKVVPDIHSRSNILSIYIYCGWREKHEKWSKTYNKVRLHL